MLVQKLQDVSCRVALGVTSAQRAVAQEIILAFDITTGAEGDKDPEE